MKNVTEKKYGSFEKKSLKPKVKLQGAIKRTILISSARL